MTRRGETVHKFFMERSASLWTAAFCIVAGVILVLYPVAVSNMFVTAPSTTDSMACAANPWQMINWHMPVASSAKGVPHR